MIITYTKIIIYLLEYTLMKLIARVRGWPFTPPPHLSREQKLTINTAFKELLSRWKLVIKQFPNSNKISSPFAHINRYSLIIKDLKCFLERKNLKDSSDLQEISFKKDCPEYFKRNYHYQTDGYFSYDSALRYDHQIELLFLGTGHIMRKVAYAELAKILKGTEDVLEFGAGTGTSGHQFKQLFPGTVLDILEPSHAYLDFARSTYPQSFNEVIPTFMERFQSTKKYDCIFSCFVMHEIPVAYWDSVIQAIKGSLKPNGHLFIIDSQQNCDKPAHQFALDQFAEDFYEPYFQEYREKSLEDYFQQQGFKLIVKNEVLFSKTLLFML